MSGYSRTQSYLHGVTWFRQPRPFPGLYPVRTGQLKCDGTRAKTRFRLSATRTSPFKSAETSVQSTTGNVDVRISGSNTGYTTFRGSVKDTGYPLHSPVSTKNPFACVTVCHHISTGVYHDRRLRCCDQSSAFWIQTQCIRDTEMLRNTQSFVCRTTGLKSVWLRNVLWSATSTEVFSITSAFKKYSDGSQFSSFTSMLFMHTARFKFITITPVAMEPPYFTYLLTYSMEQNPSWEANWFADSQEIPRISRNPKVLYRTHKRPPPGPILGPPNPVHIPTSWRSILILSTHLCLGLPCGLLPSSFPFKILVVSL